MAWGYDRLRIYKGTGGPVEMLASGSCGSWSSGSRWEDGACSLMLAKESSVSLQSPVPEHGILGCWTSSVSLLSLDTVGSVHSRGDRRSAGPHQLQTSCTQTLGISLGDLTNQGSVGKDPAGGLCVLCFLQVTGRAALQRTTLQSLGLTGGSATIR